LQQKKLKSQTIWTLEDYALAYFIAHYPPTTYYHIYTYLLYLLYQRAQPHTSSLWVAAEEHWRAAKYPTVRVYAPSF
jgi:hypothetical protein